MLNPFRNKKAEPRGPAPRWLLVLAAVILLTAGALRVHGMLFPPEPVMVRVVLNSAVFDAELADTPEKRERGLGGRASLGPRQAMYFPFPSAGRWVFWMKDMRFPIDIIWIRDGRVVDVTRRAAVPEPGAVLERYAPMEPADAVLEVAAGAADEIRVKPGDPVRLLDGAPGL